MQPDSEDGQEVNRRDVADDEIKDAGDGKEGTAFEFFAPAFQAEDPAVEEGLDGGENEDAEATDPEVHGVEGGEISGEPDDDACAHQGNEAEEADGATAIQIQAFFHKGNGGLEHGEGTGDGSDEEKKEPEEAEKLACGHVGENKGERLKAEAKGTAYCAGGSKKEESGGDGDEAPEANFAEFVARDGGGRAEGDIVPFFKIAGVVNHDSETDGEAEKDLACGGHPHFGVA